MPRRFSEAAIDTQTLYFGTCLMLRPLVLMSPLLLVFHWTVEIDSCRRLFVERLANKTKTLDNAFKIRKTRPNHLAQ